MREIKDEITKRVLEVQQSGSEELKNEFIRDFAEEAKKTTRIFLAKKGRRRPPTEDELQVALIAIDEVLKSFKPNKGASFKTFAEKVIVKRLINYFTRNVDKGKTIPLEDVTEGQMASVYMNQEREKEYRDQLREELEKFVKIMELCKYTRKDIKESTPKRSDAREAIQQIAWKIVDLGLGEQFLIEHRYSSFKKVIGKRLNEKQIIYLCACIAVIQYDLPIMKSYLKFAKKGGV